MKHKLTKKVIALVLAMMLLIGVVPTTAFASIANWEQNNVVFEGTSFGTNGYYNVISKKDYTLVPGAATETEMVINNSTGNRRQVMHIIEVDPSNPDISVLPGYYYIDKDLSDYNNWKAAGVTDLAKYYEDELGYNVVAAMNTDLDYTDNAPRILVYNGQNLAGYAGASAPRSVLYVWNNDGEISCQVTSYNKAELEAGVANGTLLHAISVSFAMTVNNGELVTKTEERTSDKAARSMVGVKEDGTLVLVMNDGRGANNSVGFNNYELGESMLALGCKWAANCDGGGSSSIVTKRAGETEGACRCVPCDGAERPTKSSVVIVSNVGPTGELNNVNIEGDYDYFAPGTSYTFDSQAIDTHGYAMDMPADAAWKLSDASFGTIADSTFVSNGTQGDVDVQVTVTNPDVTDRSVVFTNNKDLSDVKIYYWSEENENMIAWPGEAMNEYDINEFNEPRYIFDLPEGATKFIINGKKTDNSAYQTANLSFNGMTGIFLDDNFAAQPYDISTKIVGSKTIHIANPTTLTLSATETTLPYSTAEKVRKTTIPMVAKIGENDVYTVGAYNIGVTPAGAAAVDGLTITATADTSIAQAVVSITYTPTNTPFTYTVNYGKGSEVLWDFEDGDISDWVGTAEADQMMRDHGCELTTSGDWSTPFRTLTSGGQISWSNTTTTALSSVAEGGKAHSGDKALAVTFNMKNVEFNSWVYSIIWNMEGNTVLRDVANGNNATAIGCWVYIPKGFYTAKNNGAQALQLTVQKGADANNLTGTQLNLQYNGKNINALKEADIPENRWVYVKASLTGFNYVKLVDPYNDVYRSPSFIRMYVKPSEAQEMTYYFDDWTLDYSSAVDDREPPVISNPTYCTNDTNIDFADQTINTNVVSFNANIADAVASNAEGLDYSSAKIYVDGVAVNNVRASGNNMGVENVTLSNGYHKITFEIADKLGNATTLTKALTVDATAAKAAVRLSGHNDLNNAIEAGSVYYVDVKADAAEQIKSVTTTIDLQSAHEWELDHMIVADGFEASYELNPIKDNVATITITNKGSNLAGEQTLVSLPARVWSFDETTSVGGDGTAPTHMTAAQRYATSYGEPVLLMEANVTYGAVTYTDNSTGTFGGGISETTEVTGNKLKVWHEHNAEPVEDVPATCTEEGFSGRTYCDECGSVVDWGTTLPATGHSYELVDGQFVCSECDDVYHPGTGLFQLNGKYYYAINDNLQGGWQNIDDEWYFFNPSTKTTQATYNNGVVTFSFEANGKLTSGEWYDDGEGIKYYYGPDYYRCTAGNPYANVLWVDIDGNTYGFDKQGHRHEGIRLIIESNKDGELFEFSNDGKLIGPYVTDVNGLFETNGQLCYLEDGVPVAAGLVLVDGYYYYFNSSFTAVKGRYNVTRPNGLLPGGEYDFDENYRMLARNGIYDGQLYIDGVLQKCYQLIEFDGDWYFINDGNRAAKNTTLYLSLTFVDGTGFDPGYYEFDENCKMIIRNGPQENGTFYVNGAQMKAYQLLQYQGDWYFISDGHRYVKNARVYLSQQFVDGTDFVPAYYEFAEDGKLIIKNGPLDDGFFYRNGSRLNAYQLVSYEGDYYFIDDGNKYAKSKRVYLSQQFIEDTDFVPAYYDFGEDGKLIIKNGPFADGYFYRNGVRLNAYQLVSYEGDYYFIDDGNKYAKSKRVYLSQQFIEDTDFVPAYYDFGADGKLDIKNGPKDDGYFYSNGVRVSAYQLVQYEGDWYFIDDGNKYSKSKRVYLSQQFVDNTPFSVGYYEFDETGKLVVKNGAWDDGFFYINSVKQNAYRLIKYEDKYYFIDDGNKYAKNKKVYLSAAFIGDEPLEVGYYQFGADGSMQNLKYYTDAQGEVVPDLGMIFVDGEYYYVRTTGQLAIGTFKVDHTKTNDFLKGDKNFVFDENGVMTVPDYYIKGIRDGRDVGVFMAARGVTGINGRALKTGTLLRGGEIDGAINPYTNQPDTDYVKQHAIDVLKDTYGVKLDMDLRYDQEVALSAMGITHPLGNDVTHKFYDMVLYDNVFTADGKAKIKSVFEDLADADNAPVYIHCTYGLDRTGIICFLLEGALGIDEWSCVVEYCTTKGSDQPAIDKVRNGIKTNYTGATYTDKVIAFLNDCGVTNDQINSIRNIFLEAAN